MSNCFLSTFVVHSKVPDSTSHFLQCVGLPSTDTGRDHMRRLKGMLEAMMDVYTFMVWQDRTVLQNTHNGRNAVKNPSLTSWCCNIVIFLSHGVTFRLRQISSLVILVKTILLLNVKCHKCLCTCCVISFFGKHCHPHKINSLHFNRLSYFPSFIPPLNDHIHRGPA